MTTQLITSLIPVSNISPHHPSMSTLVSRLVEYSMEKCGTAPVPCMVYCFN